MISSWSEGFSMRCCSCCGLGDVRILSVRIEMRNIDFSFPTRPSRPSSFLSLYVLNDDNNHIFSARSPSYTMKNKDPCHWCIQFLIIIFHSKSWQWSVYFHEAINTLCILCHQTSFRFEDIARFDGSTSSCCNTVKCGKRKDVESHMNINRYLNS